MRNIYRSPKSEVWKARIGGLTAAVERMCGGAFAASDLKCASSGFKRRARRQKIQTERTVLAEAARNQDVPPCLNDNARWLEDLLGGIECGAKKLTVPHLTAVWRDTAQKRCMR